MAPAVEYSARVDNHAGGVDFTSHHSFGLNFHPALCKDHPVKSSGDDHAISLDLSFDFGRVTENDGLLGDDVAFDVAIDAESPSDLQSALKGYTLIDEASPFLAAAAVL